MTPKAIKNPTASQKQPLLFDDLGARQVVADFSGGNLSSDGGVLLLRQVDRQLGLTHDLAECFGDHRQQMFVDHSVGQLLAQRIFGLALGYEDLNDHDQLRRDPLLATACDKKDPLGRDRFNPRHRGLALAGPATLNRLELSNNLATRCHKLPHDPVKIQACLLNKGVRCLPKYARELVIDLDAMGHLVHGAQEGRHYSAYYDDYCYLPLYAFVGEIPLWAQLRTSDQDAATGAVAALAQIVAAIVVRGGRRVFLPWSGPELRLAGVVGADAGRRARPPLSDRGGDAAVHGVCLSNAEDLEPGPPGDWQGRTECAGGQPAVCGDQPAGPRFQRGARSRAV